MHNVSNQGHAIRVQHAVAYLPRQPTCPETRLSLQLAWDLERYNWGETWQTLVPARIGSNRCVDLAIHAAIQAQLYVIRQVPAAKAHSTRFYAEALGSLQSMIDTRSTRQMDDMILVVSILIAYEAVMGTGIQYVYVTAQKSFG